MRYHYACYFTRTVKGFAVIRAFEAVENGLLDFCVSSANPDMSQIEQFIDGPDAIDGAAYAAAYLGKAALLNFFLEHMADKELAMIGAAQGGNLAIIDDLIAKGASKDSAVLCAICCDYNYLVEYLLKNGESFNTVIKGISLRVTEETRALQPVRTSSLGSFFSSDGVMRAQAEALQQSDLAGTAHPTGQL